jgi:NADH-quinone oxidoreductase subunit G
MGAEPFRSTVTDHYLVNPICRASTVMAELSRRAAERTQAMAAE